MLELLAAVCLVRGGHDIILAAFDNFKEVLKPHPHPHTGACSLVLLGVLLLAVVASAGGSWECYVGIWGAQGGDNLGWGSFKGQVPGHVGALPGATATTMGTC